MAHGFLEANDLPEFQIAVWNQQSRHSVDEHRMVDAAAAILRDSNYSSAAISLAVVDDDAIHELNRRHLDHDWPTDVLSFILEEQAGHLEGEVIISADTAAAAAEEYGCSANDEQLLYVVHGMLHLVGYRDKSAAEAQEMRAAEARYLRELAAALSRRTAT
jgi:probable rRNA maturation factor